MLESDDVTPQVVGRAARTPAFDGNDLRRVTAFALQEVFCETRHVERRATTGFVETLQQTLLILKFQDENQRIIIA